MLARMVLGLVILATPLVIASVANGGWSWDIITATVPTPAGGALTREKGLEAAARAVRDGRDADALALIRSAGATGPVGPPAYLDLARLQLASNQLAKARHSLEQAASGFPTDPRVYLLLGSLAMGEGRLSDARLNGEKALGLLPGSNLDAESNRSVRLEATAGLAAVAEAREDWPSARTHLIAWLELESANAPARQRLGRALFHLGKSDEAFLALTQSARDDPKLGPAAVPMALLQVQAGNSAKAEEWFAYASQVEPRSATVRLTLARWRLDQSRAVEARSLVEEASKLDPDSKELEPLRGLIAWQLRELTEAERIFQALHREAPGDPGFASLLTLAMVEQDDPGQRSRGLKLAEENASRFPTALDVRAALGRAQARSGRRDQAERSLRAAIAGAGGRQRRPLPISWPRSSPRRAKAVTPEGCSPRPRHRRSPSPIRARPENSWQRSKRSPGRSAEVLGRPLEMVAGEHNGSRVSTGVLA